MLWVIMLICASLGAMIFDGEGIPLGLFLGFLLHQQLIQHRRIVALEKRLGQTPELPAIARLERPADSVPSGAPTIKEPETTLETAPIILEPEPIQPAFEPIFESPRPPRTPTIIDEGIAVIRRFLFGGNVIVRSGVVVLFFALSFLVKLAIDNDVFPIELRLAAVAAVGVGLIGAGWRLKESRRGYGLSLQGGGLAVLYLTIYTSFKVYALIPPGAAFFLLLATALLGAAIAILEDSEGLAVIGFLGGFFAPVLASTGSGDHVMLFGFYAVLNVGLIAIAWFKPWRWLNRVGFYSTFGIGAAWGGTSYRPELFGSTEPFLVFFFLCYFALSVLYATRQRRSGEKPIDGTLVFALPVVAFTLQAGMVQTFAYGLAWSSLALGAFYSVAAWLVYQRAPELLRLMVESFAAIALGLLTMTIPFALDASWAGVGWALEGAALVWLGCRQEQLRLRLFGALLQIAAGFFLFEALDSHGYEDRAAYRILVNPMTIGFVGLSLSAFFSALHLQRHRDRLPAWERVVEPIFLFIGVAWLAGVGFFEIGRLLTGKTELDAFVLYMALASGALFVAGEWLNWQGLRLAALFPLPIYYALLLPTLFSEHPLAGYGWLAWTASFAILYHVLNRTDADIQRHIRAVYHAGAFWLVLIVTTWSGAEWMQDLSGSSSSAWTMLGLLLPTLGLSLAAIQGGRAGLWPVATHRRLYTTLVLALPLTGLWIGTLYSLGSAAAATPLPYVPLLNPLDIVLGLAALTAVFWFRAARSETPLLEGSTIRTALIWVLAMTVFLWLNATIARTVHFWAGVPYDLDALLQSGLFQTTVSICWTLLAVAAMAWGHRASKRAVWFASAGLLGVVVVKLFVVDLSSLNMVMKVISFMVVGVLLLIIGYVAPVPPARDEPTDDDRPEEPSDSLR
jgi:uncharacterized membrane protein